MLRLVMCFRDKIFFHSGQSRANTKKFVSEIVFFQNSSKFMPMSRLVGAFAPKFFFSHRTKPCYCDMNRYGGGLPQAKLND